MRGRVVILGAGVGGTIVANRLARRLRTTDADILVVDGASHHVYQPGLLYLPFNNHNPQTLARPLRRLLNPRVQLLHGTVRSIDPAAHVVQVDGQRVPYDWLVLATGCRLTPERVPGFSSVHHFYDLDGAIHLRQTLRAVERGTIVVGPTRKVYKCPPAPLEFVLLLDDHLRGAGLRDRIELRYFSPVADVFHGKKVARVVNPLLDARGIRVTTEFNVKEITDGTIRSHEGKEIRFDLAVLVPPHRVAAAIETAGLAPEGWVSVDPHTLRVIGQERIFALGDVTALPIPKTGAVAHFQAPTVAEGIMADLRGVGPSRSYNGRVLCLIETGAGRATMMGFDYDRPAQPAPPSRLYHWAKTIVNRTYWWTIPSGYI